MSTSLIFSHQKLVLKTFATFANAAPGSTLFDHHINFIEKFQTSSGYNTAPYINEINAYFAGASDKALGDMIIANLGLTGAVTSAEAEAFMAANAANRVGAAIAVTNVIENYKGTDPILLAAKASLANKIDYAFNWSTTQSAVSNFPGTFEAAPIDLSTMVETLIGSSGNDAFQAHFANQAMTFQSGDKIDGGAGIDSLFMDVVVNNFAVGGTTTSIENILMRSQANQDDSGDNNIAGVGMIDAERMKSVTNWENNNSRADLIVEDVRINNNQITKDITITMRETDPGQVDYGVYFDQNSLRNVKTSTSTISLEVMDTRAVVAGRPPLDKLVVEGFGFNVLRTTGSTTTSEFVELKSPAIQAAKEYSEIVAAFQAAADAKFGVNVVKFSVGSDFTAFDTQSGTSVIGKLVTMTVAGEFTFDTTDTTNGTPGWIKNGVAPADAGEHNDFVVGGASSTDLVTSTVVLDYVGRGSVGGDLVIGGLSVGDTSSSKGVQRFEITVEDDSRVQTIASTNNTLREVTIKNGVQSRVSDAYYPVDTAGGLLQVLGASIGGGDVALPGTVTVANGSQHGNYGFSDVRLIDGSAMTGKLTFDAEITSLSKAKYLNGTDSAGNPAADNVQFAYSGGSNNDSITVAIDGNVGGSTNSLTAREDFSFKVSGNDGNDSLSVGLTDVATNWYGNQSRLNNVTIEGGAGNDTITTTSSGDFVINAGAGNDVVKIGNDGTKSKWVVSTPTDISVAGNTADLLGENANAAPVFLADGKLTVIYSGPGIAGLPIAGGVMGDDATGSISDTGVKSYTNGLEVTVDIATGDNFAVTQYHINQAIKKAINDDPVLKHLLKAEDGPTTSLLITSLVDGAHDVTDLTITAWNSKTYLATDTQIVDAYRAFTKNSLNTFNEVNTAINGLGGSIDNINLRDGFVNDATPALGFFAGTDSALLTDNVIDMGAGVDDVLVLSTSINANEIVKFSAASGIDSTVVNFSTGLFTDAAGGDKLDYTAYLTNKISTSGSTHSQNTVLTTLQTAGGEVDANEVVILEAVAFSATETWAGLSADLLKAALNSTNVAGAADYAAIAEATLDGKDDYPATGDGMLVGGVGKGVVMIENDLNDGEYKIFELSWNGTDNATAPAGDFTVITLLGTVDFGHSLVAATVPFTAADNLVGA